MAPAAAAAAAGPALDALKYTGHKEPLREMYASLIATAMDSDTLSKAHPAFLDMIKQMTPDEAKLMDFLSHMPQYPKIDVRAVEPTARASGRWAAKHFTFIAVDAGCERS